LKFDLEDCISEARQIGSRGRVVIEAFGTPGVGKSHFCDSFKTKLVENDVLLTYHSMNHYSLNRFFRVISKLSLIFYCCWYRLDLFSLAYRSVFSFSGLSFFIRIKLIFNFLLVFSVIRLRSKKGNPVLLDQGIFQAFWSCCYYQLDSTGPQKLNFLQELINQLFESLDLELLVIIYVSGTKELVFNGLVTRTIKGTSTLNSLEMDVIERGICATSLIFNVILDVLNSNPKVKLIEVPR